MQLVVVRADLNGHLKALKDYFLLAKGDFFQVRYGHIQDYKSSGLSSIVFHCVGKLPLSFALSFFYVLGVL